jgi:hypothetical protein
VRCASISTLCRGAGRPAPTRTTGGAGLTFWLSLLALTGGVAQPSWVQAQAAASEPSAAVAAPPSPSVAPAPPAEPPGYAETIDRAIREHERGHFQEARALLWQAHALFPNARTLRGLGKVEYELRNYGHAVTHLEGALSSQVRPLDARLQLEVQQLLLRARGYVGEVHVDVEPGSASVIVDGVTVASGPQASFSLMVGDHLIEFRAAGHLSERRAVRVKGGEATNLQVVLNPPGGQGAPRLAVGDEQRQDAANTRRKRWLVWSLSAAAIAGTAVALGFALREDHEPARSDGGTSGVVLRNQ